MWEELTVGNIVCFSPLFESLILQWLEKRDEPGNLYILSQPMQRQQRLLELKARVHGTWSQHLALRLPAQTGSTHHRVRRVADTKWCAFCDGIWAPRHRIETGFSITVTFENRYVQGISLPPVMPKINSAALFSPNTFLMSLVLLGRVKFSLGLKDLHKQNFLKDIASRPGPTCFDPVSWLFLPSNLGALCVCFTACCSPCYHGSTAQRAASLAKLPSAFPAAAIKPAHSVRTEGNLVLQISLLLGDKEDPAEQTAFSYLFLAL